MLPNSLGSFPRVFSYRYLMVFGLLVSAACLCLWTARWATRAATTHAAMMTADRRMVSGNNVSRVATNSVLAPPFASTITVKSTADGPAAANAANCPGAGCRLRDALLAVADGDTIDFSVTGAITLTMSELLVNKNITISGPGAASLAVAGNHASRVFHIGSGKTVTISGLTISGGRTAGGAYPNNAGGGILNDGGVLTVSNSTISGNFATDANGGLGGGIYNGGTLTLSNSLVSANFAGVGGTGGGIYNMGATVTVSNSTISDNHASGDAGGIANNAGTFNINNTTISGNNTGGGDGGGILIRNGGTVNMSNSTVSGNSAHIGGGIDGSPFTANNSTISDNTAASDGGGFSGAGTFNSCIVANNTAAHNPDISGTVSGNYNLVRDTTGATLSGSNNVTGVDPMLGPLQNNGGPTATYALLLGSPAIDKGKNFTVFMTDQRGTGFSRTIDQTTVSNAAGGDATDIGAFESDFLVVNTTAQDDDGTCSALPGGDCTLREAINAANSAGRPTILFAIPTSDPGYDAANDRYTITLTSVLPNLNSDVNIIGLGANHLTVKRDPSAATQFRIFGISSGKTVTISGLTISGGVANGGTFASGSGGGISNDHGVLTVSNCAVSGNSAFTGGGIFNDGGDSGSATLTIVGSTISGNSGVTHTGGVYSNGSLGGAATLKIRNSTFSGNSGGAVGAINSDGQLGSASLEVINSTFSGNSGGFGAGGIVNNGNGTTTIGSTILNAGASGASITNSGGTITSLGYNLSSDAAGGDATTGPGGSFNQPSDIRNTDPMLGSLQDNGGPTFTHGLACGSPAVDRGKNFNSLATDQRGPGFTRTVGFVAATGGDATDIGAFEVQAVCDTPPMITPETGITREQGTGGNTLIAEALDNEQSPNTLTVTVNNGPSATVNGVTVSNIAINGGGGVSAKVAAACSASQASFTLRATDSTGHFAEDTLTVNVSANTAPALTYNTVTVANGGSTLINPASGPSDNGSVASVVVQSQGTYAGTISVNGAGIVLVSNAGPIGSHTITIRATDNCGSQTDAPFTLNVTNNAPAITAGGAITRQQGGADTTATIATVSDPDQSGGSLTVTATTVPSGISVTGITNNSGTVTATVAASCTAALGTNTVGLTVTDSNTGSSTANFTVNVTANTAPTLTYGSISAAYGGSTAINPATATDNGSITGYSVQSVLPALTTVPTVNSSGVVSITNAQPAGPHTITIRAIDNCGAVTDSSFTLTVNKGDQTITFGALANKTFGDPDFSVSATATSGLPVNLAASGNCTVTSPSPGTIHIVNGGSCTITASQAGDANYNPAPDVPKSFTINKASQTINFGALVNKTFGDPDFSVSATSSSGLAVSFSAGGSCTVDSPSPGMVHLKGAGSCTITTSQAGNIDYLAAANVPQSFTINKGNQTITFAALANKTFGDPDFNVSGAATSGLPVSFAATGNCTVTSPSPGTVHLVNGGSCTITASQAGDANYNPAPNAPQSFAINKAGQTITFAALANKTFGDPDFLISASSSSGLSVSFSSPGNCTVDSPSPGMVHLTGAGSCSINASQAGNIDYNAAPDLPRSFNIAKANTTTTVASSINPSDFGQTVTFTATVTSGAGTPSGSVQFKDNGNNLGAAVALNAGGVAQFTTTSLTTGTHTVTAEYSSDANFLPSTGTLPGGQVVKGQLSLSIDDLSITEGQTGTKVLTFTVTLSAASSLTVTANFATADGTATAGADYVATNGTLTLNPGDTTRTIPVTVNGDINFEPDERFAVNLTSPANATISKAAGTGTIKNDDAQGGFIGFSAANTSINEIDGNVTVTVVRTNDVTQAATVEYATDDAGSSTNCDALNTGLASQRCDYTPMLGTLKFAANETQKTIDIPINLDGYTEGPETFTVKLTNPDGGAVLVTPSTTTVTINDSTSPLPNPLDDTASFVRQQYRDFLDRDADPAGLTFWTDNIDKCKDPARLPRGQTILQCIETQRIITTAAFFLSIEFQQTGNFVRSFYVAALDRPLTNNMEAFIEFERDSQAVQRSVVVGQGNWQQTLDNNRDAFMRDFVNRPEFVGLYPTSDTPTQYVDKLYLHANVIPGSAEERNDAIAEFGSAATAADAGARGRALLRITQNAAFQARELNRAFVQMEYFGYLRRNPNDAPDGNFNGYNFWVNKLNQFNGDFLQAEMVKAFLTSTEYRGRFGP